MRLREDGVGRHTCTCHAQGMGQLDAFSHDALGKWVDQKLGKAHNDCGMGWINVNRMKGPPHKDVAGTPRTIGFMRMLLWVGAGCRADRGMAACPQACPTLTAGFDEPTHGFWGEEAPEGVVVPMVPNAFKWFDNGAVRYAEEYDEAVKYLQVAGTIM